MNQSIYDFYENNKSIINLIGFTGAVCALFLQIDNFEGANLRSIQFISLVLLATEITYIMGSFWINFFLLVKDTSIRRSLGAVFATIILVFMFLYLFR
jgi:hypothetical protein